MAAKPPAPKDFEPLLPSPDISFWQELTRRKLDVWRLDSSNVPLVCYFEASQARGTPAKCFLQGDSFDEQPKLPTGAAKVFGELKNFNTEEEFREFLGAAGGRQASLADAGKKLREDIESGEALRAPARLRRLLLCSFANLKKYHYSYLIAVPVLRPAGASWPCFQAAAGAEASGFDRECLVALARNFREDEQFSGAGVCLLLGKQGNWSMQPLADLPTVKVDSEEKLAVACVDPASEDDVPGWPLQNLLMLLARHRPGRYTILAFRDPQLGGTAGGYGSSGTGQLRSRAFFLDVAATAAEKALADPTPAECLRAGWSKIATTDLTRFLDSKKVAANAVDLNVKLMKWRVLPQLEPERMQEMKFLLLGSGTLGCGVARALMGWGCRRMTFVDSGKVSYSNPVRQSLFTHRDAAEGRLKALAAREAVEAILPDAEVQDVQLDIPMPGHPHQSADVLRENIAKLQELVSTHDVVCMLTDSRESRWLPSLLVAAAQEREAGGRAPPLGLTVALGFDSFLVSRQSYMGSPSACYFCNDVTAPADSLAFRTLDQQCTVTRPGLSGLATSTAVELLAALTQHENGFGAPGTTSSSAAADSPLGAVPHQVRGYIADYRLAPAETEPFSRCICCSAEVLQRYKEDGVSFLEKVIADSSILEEISGLAAMKAAVREDEVEAFDDFDDF
eukprot:TRINITY_DN47713_c0_g1_i1.p1 TRINITY_DN47713_c0_g1~~TRINITY_DN47713_c0_g1_i1.p1  ORF type:complete len:679 (-),score=143.80 TRINITY_DN47713_c0_g1_i1:82-2118(-)